MKKKLFTLLGIMAALTIAGIVLLNDGFKSKEEDSKKIKVVTSFYPIYVATANVVADMDNIDLDNLTDNQSGCLHDYQLTTLDMKKLETADVLIINGGGMESYIQEIVKSYPDIAVIDTSKNITFLESTEHDHDVDESKENITEKEQDNTKSKEVDAQSNPDSNQIEEDGEYNAHVWLNTENYLIQIDNIKNGLALYDEENAKKYSSNATAYQNEIIQLKNEMQETILNPENKEVIIFHDSFAYLAEELNLEVIHTVNLDSDTSLSAGDIAEVIDEVNLHDIKVLFTEEQYSDSVAKSIAQETNSKVYIIDSLVTGPMSKDSYLEGMRKNLEVLKEALYVN